VKTSMARYYVAPLCVVGVLMAGCGGGGSSGSSASTSKSAAQLSAEASAAMAATTSIPANMDWKGSNLSTASAGEVSVTSTSSMGDVSILVSSVDYKDPTTGLVDTTAYRGTTFYDSRTDDPNKTASSIDAAQLNARFSLSNVNFRSADAVFVEVFSTTKGLAYQEVVATSSIRGKTFVVNVK
jgi:hypothetical protein